jgi:UDP-glucose 4-epimerase
MKRVLVTGAYGYIGSHTVKRLADYGYKVTAVDNAVSSNDILKYVDKYYHIDVTDPYIKHFNMYDACIHLAGKISVAESVSKPWKYINNNIIGTKNALTFFHADNFIFASTAAAFNPVSPYAQTKLMCESLIKTMRAKYTIFRFFNVAGSNGEFGQIGEATHLIRIASEAAAGRRPYMNLYGTDWETRDGTCIRDSIHVMDLVEGIIKAVEHPANSDFECLGTGEGISCKEAIDVMKQVSGVDFKVRNVDRRPGDHVIVTIPKEIGRSVYVDIKHSLEDICESAYNYEKSKCFQ